MNMLQQLNWESLLQRWHKEELKALNFFTGLKIVKIMHFFSLNDLIKTDNGSFTKVAEDLDKLCFKAFPRHNKKRENLEKTGCHVKKNINDLKVSWRKSLKKDPDSSNYALLFKVQYVLTFLRTIIRTTLVTWLLA